MLAGLLYMGSGVGLAIYRMLIGASWPRLNPGEMKWLAAVLTALLAWIVFKENFDRRIATGMAAIVAGALLLSWPQPQSLPGSQAGSALWPALAVLLACLFWALDNNFAALLNHQLMR